MKLDDLKKAFTQGTYAGVKFSNDSAEKIKKFAYDNGIPKALRKEKLHTTLLYSRKHLPNYEAAGKYDQPMVAAFKGWDIFLTRPAKGNPTRALVLKLDCLDLWNRWSFLMNEHQATYDFLDYVPHVTLSYDIGEFDYQRLPVFEDTIEIVEEYMSALDLDWAEKNG